MASRLYCHFIRGIENQLSGWRKDGKEIGVGGTAVCGGPAGKCVNWKASTRTRTRALPKLVHAALTPLLSPTTDRQLLQLTLLDIPYLLSFLSSSSIL
jgi:hypothetical protein